MVAFFGGKSSVPPVLWLWRRLRCGFWWAVPTLRCLRGWIMCGRFTLRAAASVIAEQFAVFDFPPFSPRFNVAPSQPVPVVRLRGGGDVGPRRELVAMQWGLVPSWANDPAIGGRLINARAETVGQKPAFRAAYRSRRCLVVADGFYEWQRAGRRRQAYFFHRPDDGPFGFAGLWEHWEGAEGGSLESCTIVTTEAGATVRPVHDRAPVIVGAGDYEAWLDPAVPMERVASLLRPAAAGELVAVAVGSYVNDARHEGPECIEAARGLF